LLQYIINILNLNFLCFSKDATSDTEVQKVSIENSNVAGSVEKTAYNLQSSLSLYWMERVEKILVHSI